MSKDDLKGRLPTNKQREEMRAKSSMEANIHHSYKNVGHQFEYLGWDIAWSGWRTPVNQILDIGFWFATKTGEPGFWASTTLGSCQFYPKELDPIDLIHYPGHALFYETDQLRVIAVHDAARRLMYALDAEEVRQARKG